MKGTYNRILDFMKKKFEGNNARVKSSYLQSPCRESKTLEMNVGVFLVEKILRSLTNNFNYIVY